MRNYIDSKLLLCEVFGSLGEIEDAPDISQNTIRNILKGLTEKEAAAVLYRFGEGLSYSQIGLRLGVTKERISQILHRALKKLRQPLRLGGDVRKIDSDDIGNLALTLRAQNALRYAGINKISDLNTKTDRELLLIKNIGIKLFSEIRNSLDIYRMEG
jgi:transcriptional regulator with XRE-family HTH domain